LFSLAREKESAPGKAKSDRPHRAFASYLRDAARATPNAQAHADERVPAALENLIALERQLLKMPTERSSTSPNPERVSLLSSTS